MERVLEALQKTDKLTEAQRLILKENHHLTEGELTLVSPMKLRLHHFPQFGNLGIGFVESYGDLPWDYGNYTAFWNTARDFSLTVASYRAQIVVDRLRYMQVTGNKGHAGYYADLVGTTPEDHLNYEISIFLNSFNFLLRSYQDKNQWIHLSYDPDLICRACRGGKVGVGKHCSETDPEGPDVHTLDVLRSLRRSSAYSDNLRPESDGTISLQLSRAYDPGFNDIVLRYVKRRVSWFGD